MLNLNQIFIYKCSGWTLLTKIHLTTALDFNTGIKQSNMDWTQYTDFFYSAVVWLKYCRYGVKHYPINQSIYFYLKTPIQTIKTAITFTILNISLSNLRYRCILMLPLIYLAWKHAHARELGSDWLKQCLLLILKFWTHC